MNGKSSGCVLCENPYTGAITPTKLTDRSRFGNDGVFSNITQVQLPSGLWVYSCNGSNSAILPGKTMQELGCYKDFTYYVWCKTAIIGSTRYMMGTSIAGGANMCDLGQTSAGNYVFYVNTGAGAAITLSSSVPAMVWRQVVGTYDGTNQSIYVNGLFDNSSGNTGMLDTTANYALGQPGEYVGLWFSGLLAIPRILNRALSPAEIRTSFQNERAFFGV